MAFACLLLLGACGSNNSATEVTDPEVVKDQIRAVAKELEEKSFPQQASLLEDGVLTDAEHRQAVVWTIECIQRQGLRTTDFWKVETLTSYSYDWLTEPGPGGSHAMSRTLNDCQQEFHFGIQEAVKLQDQGAIREEVLPDLVACLRESGVEVGDHPTMDDVSRAGRSADKNSETGLCMAEATGKLDLGPTETPPFYNQFDDQNK